MKQKLIVLLSIIVIGSAVGCKNKQTIPPQSQPEGIIIQKSTGDCSTNVVSTKSDNVKVQSPCPPTKDQYTVTRTDGASVIQESSGNNSVNIVSTGTGSVTVTTDNIPCADGKYPIDKHCDDGSTPK